MYQLRSIETVHEGARDHGGRPFGLDARKVTAHRTGRDWRFTDHDCRNGPDPREPARDECIVGASELMREVYEMVTRVAPTRSTVLIQGETGTGKELVARAIHEASPRAGRPFVTVDCSALAESLLESELFGHVKGAFTGALAEKRGLFEAAHGGTCFLDEVGEISP